MIKTFIILIFTFLVCIPAYGQNQLFSITLREDGFGAAKIGMTPSEASDALGIPLTLGREPDEDDIACHYIHPNGEYEDIGFMVIGGRIVRIDVYSDKISAIGKIRIGDSETVVNEAFPNKVRETIHPYIGKEGKYLTVDVTSQFSFVFETDLGTITRFRSGTIEAVQYIEGCL